MFETLNSLKTSVSFLFLILSNLFPWFRKCNKTVLFPLTQSYSNWSHRRQYAVTLHSAQSLLPPYRTITQEVQMLSNLWQYWLMTPLTYNSIGLRLLTLMIVEQSVSPMIVQCSAHTYELMCPVALSLFFWVYCDTVYSTVFGCLISIHSLFIY